MHEGLRLDKQILEELFDAKFLCASSCEFHKLLLWYDSRGGENIIKSGTNVSESVRKIIYTYDQDPHKFGLYMHIFES